jgi:steroid delta-isomerase
MTETQVPVADSAALRQVHRFYELVDAGDAAGVADLFAVRASYYRPGYEPMVGREQVLRFYSRDRIIKDGAHTLETIIVERGEVAVHGQFHGQLHDGSPIGLRFADFFALDADQLISERRTFYFTHTV